MELQAQELDKVQSESFDLLINKGTFTSTTQETMQQLEEGLTSWTMLLSKPTTAQTGETQSLFTPSKSK